MGLRVDIEKRLGAFHLQVSFEADEGVLALLGASGCGKSMTLKCIAGIEKPDRGHIELDGRTLFDSEKKINLPPQKRHVGYLFQQYALFPNMTVRQNIAAGLRNRENRDAVVDDAIRAMHLRGLENKRPHQLSGGQQQRVALARILVNEPELLLLDEPFSALDSHLRFQLEREVRSVIQGFGKPVILVSHNQEEVFHISDNIAIFHDGNLENVGSKEEVFENPGTRSGAILTGCDNISAIKKLGPRRVLATDWGVELTLARDLEDESWVGIRMSDIRSGPGENSFRCPVSEIVENPFSVTAMLQLSRNENAAPLGWEMNRDEWEKQDPEHLEVCLPSEALLLLKE